MTDKVLPNQPAQEIVPPNTGASPISVTILPCLKGAIDFPGRNLTATSIFSLLDSKSKVGEEDVRKGVLIGIPSFTLLMRVQTNAPSPFKVKLASRIIELNGTRSMGDGNDSGWIAEYNGVTTSEPLITSVEDFLVLPAIGIFQKDGRRLNEGGPNLIIQRIEAWTEVGLVNWVTICHRVFVE